MNKRVSNLAIEDITRGHRVPGVCGKRKMLVKVSAKRVMIIV